MVSPQIDQSWTRQIVRENVHAHQKNVRSRHEDVEEREEKHEEIVRVSMFLPGRFNG